MNRRERKNEKNELIMNKYINKITHENIDIYSAIQIIHIILQDTPHYDIYALMLSKARKHFGGKNLESQYHWHTCNYNRFFIKREVLKTLGRL